jgi:hypothetical protein
MKNDLIGTNKEFNDYEKNKSNLNNQFVTKNKVQRPPTKFNKLFILTILTTAVNKFIKNLKIEKYKYLLKHLDRL